MRVSSRVRSNHGTVPPDSAFAGFRFPAAVIVVAVRYYLRYKLSYRDVAELLTERGVFVDPSNICRWVQRFAPLLQAAARPCRHSVGTIWRVDETYVKVAGKWRYVYRAVDQYGQVVDVYLSLRRNKEAARRFFQRALSSTMAVPEEIVTDKAQAYVDVAEDETLQAFHNTQKYHNNAIENDHGHLKGWLRPMRGLGNDACTRRLIAGHAFVQNIGRGHSALTSDVPEKLRVRYAFEDLSEMI